MAAWSALDSTGYGDACRAHGGFLEKFGQHAKIVDQ